jgi:hypothetical protein
LEHDVLGRETRAVTAYGATYEAPFDAHVEEHYEGTVGVSTTDPARAWARATTRYRVRWPEADVATAATLVVSSDADAYHVVITTSAGEAGVAGGVERRYERTIPRRLA